jgi:hypothetical protein
MSTWEGNRRSDGTVIAQTFEANWVILPARGDEPLIDYCPCCRKPLHSPQAAMAVADAFVPVTP